MESNTPLNSLLSQVRNNDTPNGKDSVNVDSSLINKNTTSITELNDAISGNNGLNFNLSQLTDEIVKLNFSLKKNAPVNNTSNNTQNANQNKKHHNKWQDEYTDGNRSVPKYRPTLTDKIKDFSPLKWAAEGTMFEDPLARMREKSKFKRAGGTGAGYEQQQRAAREFHKIHEHERGLRSMGLKQNEIDNYQETSILGESMFRLGFRKKQAKELLGSAFTGIGKVSSFADKITPDKIVNVDILNKAKKASPLSGDFNLTEEESENYTVQRNILETLEDIRDNCCGGFGSKFGGKGEKDAGSAFSDIANAVDFVDDALDVGKHLKFLRTAGTLASLVSGLAVLAGGVLAVGTFLATWKIGDELNKLSEKWLDGNYKPNSAVRRTDQMKSINALESTNPDLHGKVQGEIKTSLQSKRDLREEENKNRHTRDGVTDSDYKPLPQHDNPQEEVDDTINSVYKKYQKDIEKRKLGGPVETNKKYIAGEAGQELFISNDGKYSREIGNRGSELLESSTSGFVYPITGMSEDGTLTRKYLDTDESTPQSFIYPEESSENPTEIDKEKTITVKHHSGALSLIDGVSGASGYGSGGSFDGMSGGLQNSIQGIVGGVRSGSEHIMGSGVPNEYHDDGSSGKGNHTGPTTPVSTKQSAMMKQVYDSFKNAGFSDKQAKALAAEVGRENDYNAKTIFGNHNDAANGANNLGFFSWQGDRKAKLEKHLTEKGLMKDGKMVQSQESLNAMAEFSKQEMESGKFKGMEGFLDNKDIDSESAAKILGKKYIKWAYGQDVLKNGTRFDWRKHDNKRNNYYNQMEDFGNSESSTTPTTQTTPIQTTTNKQSSVSVNGQIPESMKSMRIKTSNGQTKTVGDLGITTFDELQQKGGQAFQGGKNDPATLIATNMIAQDLGDNFDRVTAQNDAYHARNAPESGHTQGVKTDFTVKNMSYKEAHKRASETMARKGLVEGKDFKIISSPHGTGNHIDFKLLPSGQKKINETQVADEADPMAPGWDKQLAADTKGKGTASAVGGIDDSNTLTTQMMNTTAYDGNRDFGRSAKEDKAEPVKNTGGEIPKVNTAQEYWDSEAGKKTIKAVEGAGGKDPSKPIGDKAEPLKAEDWKLPEGGDKTVADAMMKPDNIRDGGPDQRRKNQLADDAAEELKQEESKKAKPVKKKPVKKKPPVNKSLSSQLDADENKAMNAAMQQAMDGPAGKAVPFSSGGSDRSYDYESYAMELSNQGGSSGAENVVGQVAGQLNNALQSAADGVGNLLGNLLPSNQSLSSKLDADENKAMNAAMQQAMDGPAGKPVAFDTAKPLPSQPNSGKQLYNQSSDVAQKNFQQSKSQPQVTVNNQGNGRRTDRGVNGGGHNVGGGGGAKSATGGNSPWQNQAMIRYGLGNFAT